MRLTQMQDIGGCRAVLSTVAQVKKRVAKYKEFHAKSPKDRSDWDGSDNFDYILQPKPDGYRSVHLVFSYKSTSAKWAMYNGQLIEVQIRSKLQHLWATAVETAQIFTGQALKSKVKSASDDWLRFFALTSSAFALREKSPTVPGTSSDANEIVSELVEILRRTKIIQNLWGWSSIVRHLEIRHTRGARFYLLSLNLVKGALHVRPFKPEEEHLSQREYEKAEKDTEGDPNTQVVLVSVDHVESLRKAYPNYYVDTRGFISAVVKEINGKSVKVRQ
jgi:hypothetical protein